MPGLEYTEKEGYCRIGVAVLSGKGEKVKKL